MHHRSVGQVANAAQLVFNVLLLSVDPTDEPTGSTVPVNNSTTISYRSDIGVTCSACVNAVVHGIMGCQEASFRVAVSLYPNSVQSHTPVGWTEAARGDWFWL